MNKKKFTVDDFRRILQQIIEDDRIHFSHGQNSDVWETLNKLSQLSDEGLLEAKLYADLGLDSIDVWEMICVFERDYGVFLTDDVGEDFGTGVGLTVRKYLEAVNTHQYVE